MIEVKTALLSAIKLWQKTRAFRRPACRFYPSCSQYLNDAIVRHGLVAGCFLGIKRCLKCHPFHEGGIDEVPETLPRLRFQRALELLRLAVKCKAQPEESI
ncbi:MAG TPA: membrane protein insertion efficiency factor YidD [Candidatus Obscuribacterales bacterium]